MTDEPPTVPRLVSEVVGRLPSVLEEVAGQLATQHPGYAGFVDTEFRNVLAGAEAFTERVFRVAAEGHHSRSGFVTDGERALFMTIGREHYHQHQDIDALLAAYRIGAAVAWRHIADVALGHRLPSTRFAGLAAAVFAAVEELSAASRQGYVAAESERRQSVRRHRHELLELLLSEGPSRTAIDAVAARADWPVPECAAVVLVDDTELREQLDGHGVVGDGPVLVVPDPDRPGRSEHLRSLLHGRGAVLGSTVPVDRLHTGLELARLAARLRDGGLLTGDPLVVDDHLDALIVHRDEQLLEALRTRLLAPVLELPGSSADRLVETLGSWLLHLGNGRAVAEELHVHPQTVRYRLGRLRELLDLDTPRHRAALLLAVGWPGTDPAEGSGTDVARS
ncbi:helix-turn-helix domain-containing protein [Pseudonocardia kujensis]|uniref:PucR family transcriptional regulator n=1 Tax=Pseudonocardia kujensis TaxID=1128675 RepID=UPI001E411A26|nr:PucR family transcriptional regulator [Pseudonocardia kujensis]MCE0764521.1 helix-turn-helix domain-containing protein [Pseudonocardia kujensis]